MKITQTQNYLSKISKEDLFSAMVVLDNEPVKTKSLIRHYIALIDVKGNEYPPPELIRIAYNIASGDILPDGFFNDIGKNSEHFQFLKKMGFDVIKKELEVKKDAMMNKRILVKLIKSQDISGEFYIPKKYTGKDKFFPDPRLENPHPIDSSPHSVELDFKWKSEKSTGKLVIKTFRKDEHDNADTRLAVTPKLQKKHIEHSAAIIEYDPISNKYEGQIIHEGSEAYEKIYHLPEFEKGYVELNDKRYQEIMHKSEFMKPPLNQILYGPPGTGKTYSTITKALNIIGLLEEKDSYTKEEYEKAQNLFQKELGKRIEFVTMHQSFSYEDFVQGLKPQKSEDGNGISFDYKNGVFKEICKRAELLVKEYRLDSIEDRIDFDVVYNYSFKSLFEDDEPIEIERGSTKFVINDFSEKTLWFETSNGTTHPRYTLAKKTLKRIYDSQVNNVINSGNKGYFDATLELLLKNENIIKRKKEVSIPNQNINHVIILDEINRANISRVFGELIALIEEDKRDGKLTATLPSGDTFTVPSNLFIIGTMNTADKSIALVDIALRRRFKFVPLYPDLVKLKMVLGENGMSDNDMELRIALFENINRIIRSKKSVDFEIGHSYFMEKDTLINILNHQILPLMNEYFMYDLRKVKEIIEQPQKDREGKIIPKLGIELNKTLWKERGLLEVEKISSPTQEVIVDASVDIDTDENDN